MQGLNLTHLQFDEQWTCVAKKQSRLTINERAECHDKGDVYLWTCIDQKTKLMPSFVHRQALGRQRPPLYDGRGRPARHAQAARQRRARLRRPAGTRQSCKSAPMASPAYPEAVDLAFGPYVKFGTIIKEYRNANMIYTPTEMVGTKRDGLRSISERQQRTICTSHVERLNGTQRLFMKRLNRLTSASRKKLATWKRLSPCSRPTTISAGRLGSRARAARSGRARLL